MHFNGDCSMAVSLRKLEAFRGYSNYKYTTFNCQKGIW
jgi:hypothetical protein